MSYNRDIRDDVSAMREEIKTLTSLIGGLNESLLQYSDFFKQFADKDKRQKEAKQEEEDKQAKREKELLEQRINLENQKQALEALKLSQGEERNRKESEIFNEYYDSKVDELSKKEQKLAQEEEIDRLIREGRKKEAEQLAERYNLENEFKDKLAKLPEEIQKTTNILGELNKTLITEVAKMPEKIVDTLVTMQTNAVSQVQSVYQQHAGKLSAMLDTSVEDISQMQNNIAEQLKSTNLNRAISNVQVLEEASKLAASGYTNETKIQQTATDIAIARQVAPNLDIDNASVKNLINVFGSDFTSKFAGISSAVQDSAGSLAAVESTLGSMMTDLEPVFLNAELQSTASQGIADVEATLSAAQEQGLLSEADVKNYSSMLVELMDPSKALTSSNVAVRTAAANLYQSGNYTGDLDQALEALLSSSQNIMGNFGQSMTSQDVVFRSFGAKAFGLPSTMTAAYNPEAYTGVNMVYAGDIDQSYEEQLSKLQSGDYTTTETQESNLISNSDVTQALGNYAKSFPQTYKITSAAIIATINSVGSSLTSGLKGTLDGTGGFGSSSKKSASGSAKTSSKGGGYTTEHTLGGLLSTEASKGIGSGTLSKITGANLSSGTAAMIGLSGLTSAMNVAEYALANDDQTTAQKLSYGGDKLQATLSGASVGATAGMLAGTVIPGLGNAAGTAIGAIAGAVGGYITASHAQKEAAEEQTKALEAQTKATEDLLGDGIKPLTEVEKASANQGGKATMAIGNNTYALADFDDDKYASVMSSNAGGLDFVPYDNYIARLHKGEAVVTAKAANEYRQNNPQFWRDSSGNNNNVVRKLDEQTNRIVSALIGSDQKPLNSGSMFTQTYTIANQNT